MKALFVSDKFAESLGKNPEIYGEYQIDARIPDLTKDQLFDALLQSLDVEFEREF